MFDKLTSLKTHEPPPVPPMTNRLLAGSYRADALVAGTHDTGGCGGGG